jgi:hypothetical protein
VSAPCRIAHLPCFPAKMGRWQLATSEGPATGLNRLRNSISAQYAAISSRWHAGIRIARRMRKKATFLPARPRRVKDAPCPRQGRSEVRDAKKNERHVCGRARAGERPVSQRRIVHSYPPTPSLPRLALVPWPYGELLNDARTPLADLFPHPVKGKAAKECAQSTREGEKVRLNPEYLPAREMERGLHLAMHDLC